MMMKGQEVKATVLRHSWTTSGNGNPALRIVCACVSDTGETEELIGNIYFSEKSVGMARAQLKHLGFDIVDGWLGDIKDDETFMDVKLPVVIDEYKGTLKIGKFGPAKNPPPSEVALEAATEKLRSAKKAKDEDLPLDDENIPF